MLVLCTLSLFWICPVEYCCWREQSKVFIARHLSHDSRLEILVVIGIMAKGKINSPESQPFLKVILRFAIQAQL